MATAVAVSSQSIDFGVVGLGTTGPDISVDPSFGPPRISFNGGVQINSAPTDAIVTARIIGDSAHLMVRDITILEWVMEEVDRGELPPGFKGKPPKVRVLEQAGQSAGPGPLAVKKGQLVLVRVRYQAPTSPGAVTATLIIQGDTWAPIAVPLALSAQQLPKVTTEFISTPLVIWQGQQAAVPIAVHLDIGPAIDAHFEMSVLQLHTGLTLLPNSFHLEAGKTTNGILTFQAAPDAPLGENTVFVDQHAPTPAGLLLPVQITPVPETVLAQRALQKITEKYARIGGQNSPLGLPADPSMPVRNSGGTFTMDFRGGRISIADPINQSATAIQTVRVEVWWVGLECQVRQESEDEMYGAIGIIAPGILLAGTASHGTIKFPGSGNDTIQMGKDGERILMVGELLYGGPPTDVLIGCQLIEHDSGNVAAAKQSVSDSVDKAAQALGRVGGVSAEHLATDVNFIAGVLEDIIDLLGDPLGASDDAYNPETLTIHWEAQTAGFPKQTLTRPDDPGKIVTYTHSQVVSGRDDGGDLGRYAFYFDVRVIPQGQPL